MKNIFGKTQRAKDPVVAVPETEPFEDDNAHTQPVPSPSGEPSERWVGYIDHIERSVITGWCFDREHPEHPVVVEVVASNGKIKRTVAGVFRQDVKDAGYGHGNFGFELDVASLGLKNESLIVRFAESRVAISKMPFSLDPQRALLEGTLPSSYRGAMQMLALEAQARHAELEGPGVVR